MILGAYLAQGRQWHTERILDFRRAPTSSKPAYLNERSIIKNLFSIAAAAIVLTAVAPSAFAEEEAVPTSRYYDTITDVFHFMNYLPGHMSTEQWCDLVVGSEVHRNADRFERRALPSVPGCLIMPIKGVHWNTFAAVHEDVEGNSWPIAHYAKSQCEIFRQQAIDVGTDPWDVESITLEESDFR